MRSGEWGPSEGMSGLIREGRDLSTLSTTWGYSRRAAVCKSGRKPPPEPDDAGTMILDFQSSELWENKRMLFKPPTVWYFVMAALADRELRDTEFEFRMDEKVLGNGSWWWLHNMPINLILNCTVKMVSFILWPPDVKSRLIGKDSDAGKDWEQEEEGVI